MTISLSIALTFQPDSMNCCASQSSSSGCEGQVPCEPRSSGVVTSPWPKTSFQSRLTMTRATRGLSSATNQLARSSRDARRSFTAIGPSDAGTPGLHDRPRVVQPVASRQHPNDSGRDRSRDQGRRNSPLERRSPLFQLDKLLTLA